MVESPERAIVAWGRDFVAHIPAEPAHGKRARTFSQPMQCWRCLGRDESGAQCDRISCEHLPMCARHLRSHYWLRVGRTQLEDREGNRFAFKGVFADRPGAEEGEKVFRKGDRVAIYFGERKSREQLSRDFGIDHTAPYALAVSDGVIDAACVRSVGALVNTHRRGGDVSPQGGGTNCRYAVQQRPGVGHVNMVATRNIYQGQELLAPYGRDYAFDIEHN
jgi:hypothetical protein